MKLLGIFIFTMISVSAWAQIDSPDEAQEAQLFQIYQSYYAEPVSTNQWQQLVGERATETLEIQTGDNLWNLSQTLFGDGAYWPKLWSENSSITNPHLVKPRNILRLIRGNAEGPPTLSIEPAAAAKSLPLTETSPSENSEVAREFQDVEIPPPSVISRPVVLKLPPSLPEYQNPGQQGTYDVTGFEFAERAELKPVTFKPLSYYVSAEPQAFIGSVAEVAFTDEYAVGRDEIYVYVNRDQNPQPGSEYTVVRSMGILREGLKRDELHPEVFEVEGRIRLINEEALDLERANKGLEKLFRATVASTLGAISRGSHLTVEPIPIINTESLGRLTNLVGRIIGGDLAKNRRLIGAHSLVFVDLGTRDGLQVGQELKVRANRSLRKERTRVFANRQPIARVKVVHVTPNFATGLVLASREPIFPGDLTGEENTTLSRID